MRRHFDYRRQQGILPTSQYNLPLARDRWAPFMTRPSSSDIRPASRELARKHWAGYKAAGEVLKRAARKATKARPVSCHIREGASILGRAPRCVCPAGRLGARRLVCGSIPGPQPSPAPTQPAPPAPPRLDMTRPDPQIRAVSRDWLVQGGTGLPSSSKIDLEGEISVQVPHPPPQPPPLHPSSPPLHPSPRPHLSCSPTPPPLSCSPTPIHLSCSPPTPRPRHS